MGIRICSLASGSSGNCYVIWTNKTTLLVDAGISGKQIRERLSGLGLDLETISAVLITHEHSDHVKGLSALVKLNKNIFASKKTLEEINLSFKEELCQYISGGEKFTVGDITVQAFSTSHDAVDPLGFHFTSEGKSISLVTDTGCLNDEITGFMKASDIIVLESNHDENILKMGSYPWFLKQRILSDCGHLSNETSALALAKIVASENSEKKRLVLLAHLSKENNFPEMAKATMENILKENDCMPRACIIRVLPRNEVSEVYE